MTARDRRAVILGLAGILGAVFVLRLVPWTLRATAALRARAEQQAVTVAQARAVLAAAPSVRDSLARVLADIVALAPTLIDGRSQAEAQASLSALVSLAANRNAMRVVRLDPLPDSSAGVFNRVTVHAELEGDVSGLSALMASSSLMRPLSGQVPTIAVD